MELQLKNIGMIKEASVKIDGLTVIAGENDTGKSTVGKALLLILKYIILLKQMTNANLNFNNLNGLDNMLEFLFSSQLSKDGSIKLYKKNKNIVLIIKNNKIIPEHSHLKDIKFYDDILFPIMIETPLVWNFNKFFNQISLIESRLSRFGDNVEISRPFLLEDLHFKMSTNNKNKSSNYDIEKDIFNIINGNFKQDDLGNFFFEKEGKKIDLLNTATGIKSFGIFQVLSQNKYLGKDTVLILDEPEVHLHPKWQLEMAKVIVELVKNGVKIIVNSHSPYMIEALQRYGELSEINADFYLAEDGYIHKIEDSNSQTLSKIFEKLSEPFDVFEEMDSQSMESLLNG